MDRGGVKGGRGRGWSRGSQKESTNEDKENQDNNKSDKNKGLFIYFF